MLHHREQVVAALWRRLRIDDHAARLSVQGAAENLVAGLRHRGIGVLITDHNVEQTLDIVDRAYIMFEGKVQASGSVRDLVYDDRVAQLYLGPTLTARLRARLEAVA